jgi:hypothetical protein
MDDLLRERGCRLDFTLEFVKYGQYSPHSSEKSSAPRPLATTAMDGGKDCSYNPIAFPPSMEVRSAGFAGATNRSVPILEQPPSVPGTLPRLILHQKIPVETTP